MDWNLKNKMGQAAALSLVAFTSILNAASDDAQLRNLDNRVTALEQKKGAGGMINPPARPVVKDGADLFIYGEVLVWKAHQDDMTYAVKLNSLPAADTANSGQFANWKGKWSAGFRLGLGYNMGHDGWDTQLVWTRFHSTSHRNTAGNHHGIFSPTYAVQPHAYAVTNYAEEAHNKKWKLRLDMIDWELGREFFVSKWLTIRPHMGLRNIWARQRMNVEYEDGTYATAVLANFLADARESWVRNKNNFWGIGLRGGLDTQWGMGCGFSIFGKLALSALWGQMKIRQSNKLFTTGQATSLTANQFRDTFHVVRPVADLAIGLRYDTTFSDDSYALGVYAGWEHHYFWSQNKLFRFDTIDPAFGFSQNAGDLSTSGVNVGLSFDF